MTGTAGPDGTAPARPPGAVAEALPGILAAMLMAAAASALHGLLPALPWLTWALLLGVALGCLPAARRALDGVLRPGLRVAARSLLRLGIVLLGLQLSLGQIAELGALAVLAIAALVGVAFGVTWAIARVLHLPGDEPVLLAAGFAICGVSAIGAVGAARRSTPDDAGVPTALVTLYGSLAIVVLPALASLLGLDARAFGAWAGASVHDVGQVVATAGTAGGGALAVAVVVKLTRVLTLAPVTALVAVQARRHEPGPAAGSASATPTADAIGATPGADAGGESGTADAAGASTAPGADGAAGESSAVHGAGARLGDPAQARPTRPPLVPAFILGFAALVLLNSVLAVPDAVVTAAAWVQTALLATALVAIGASLRLERLVASGWRALLAGALAWAVILALALGVAALIG